ncbi:MAG: DUF4157 domain-containing protein [Bacteroidota bacterium]
MRAFASHRTEKGASSILQQKKGEDSFFGVQAKLSIGKPNDKYEHEADAVADQVVAKSKKQGTSFFPRTQSPLIQKLPFEEVQKQEKAEEIQEKPIAQSITPVAQLAAEEEENIQEKCSACEAEEQQDQVQSTEKLQHKEEVTQDQHKGEVTQDQHKGETVQKKCSKCEAKEKGEKKIQTSKGDVVQQKEGGHGDSSSKIESSLKSSKGGGSPMDPTTRQQMESGFGADFGNVRIHTNSTSIQMNQGLGAQAFTNGNDIYFNQGKYQPKSNDGQHLLAHELTHVIQQKGSSQSKIQRATCTNDPATAPSSGMSGCSTNTSRPNNPNSTLNFSSGGSGLSSSAKTSLSGIAAKWHADARNDTIRIDSYASCDGSPSPNWKLSCSRTKAVEAELKAPSDGTPGIPNTAIFKKFSHGETEEFSTSSADDNRVAQVTLQPTATAPPSATPVAGGSDFVINRIPNSTQQKIYFAQGSKTLTADGLLELIQLKISAPPNVSLVGFTSMEEPTTLALERATVVKNVLKNGPLAVPVTSAVGNPAATATRSDFARARSVEIIPSGSTPDTLDCDEKDGAGDLVNPPKAPCATMDPATVSKFTGALTVANQAMVEAVNAIDPAHADYNEPLVKQFFGNSDPSTLATLATNMGNLQTHVTGLPAITDCGGQCDTGGCESGGVIAYNSDVDAASRMTLCVPVFKGMALNDRARNLIHESAHGTSPLGGVANPTRGTKDVAYRHERMMFHLSPEDRLRNSDSYALFALYAKEVKSTGNPAAIPADIATPSVDNITGITGADLDAIKLAVAQLEKRASWASSHTNQLFGEAQEVQSGAQTWAATWAEDYMDKAATLFPVNDTSVAPQKPTMDDMVKLAAIVERYKLIKRRTKRPFNISAMPTGVINWPAGSGGLASDSFQVGADFFRASPEEQISLLLQHLAGATQDVETAFIPAYVEFARWIHERAS